MSNGLCPFVEGEIVYHLLIPDLKLLRNLGFYFSLWKSPGIINPAIISLAFSQRSEYKKIIWPGIYIFSCVDEKSVLLYTCILFIERYINLFMYFYIYTNICVYVHIYIYKDLYILTYRYIFYIYTYTSVGLHYHPDIHSSHPLKEITWWISLLTFILQQCSLYHCTVVG